MPDHQTAQDVLARLPGLHLAVVGDFALDAYWHLQADADSVSLETGLPVHQVQSQNYSPGAAGNVAINLRALGVGQVSALGIRGEDLFGAELDRLLHRAGVDVTGLLPWQASWQTPVFAKPHTLGVEGSRFDFGSTNALVEPALLRFLERLDQTLPHCDGVILNQQLLPGLLGDAVLGWLEPRLRALPAGVLVDARDRSAEFSFGVLKLNEAEARNLASAPTQSLAELAATLQQRRALPVFITRGADGMLCADATGVHDLPGHRLAGAVDPVGAGDTAAAVIAASLAAGASPLLAAHLANAAAAVSATRIATTGFATPEEILELLP